LIDKLNWDRNAKPPSTGGIFGGGGTSSPIFGTLHRGFTVRCHGKIAVFGSPI